MCTLWAPLSLSAVRAASPLSASLTLSRCFDAWPRRAVVIRTHCRPRLVSLMNMQPRCLTTSLSQSCCFPAWTRSAVAVCACCRPLRVHLRAVLVPGLSRPRRLYGARARLPTRTEPSVKIGTPAGKGSASTCVARRTSRRRDRMMAVRLVHSVPVCSSGRRDTCAWCTMEEGRPGIPKIPNKLAATTYIQVTRYL